MERANDSRPHVRQVPTTYKPNYPVSSPSGHPCPPRPRTGSKSKTKASDHRGDDGGWTIPTADSGGSPHVNLAFTQGSSSKIPLVEEHFKAIGKSSQTCCIKDGNERAVEGAFEQGLSGQAHVVLLDRRTWLVEYEGIGEYCKNAAERGELVLVLIWGKPGQAGKGNADIRWPRELAAEWPQDPTGRGKNFYTAHFSGDDELRATLSEHFPGRSLSGAGPKETIRFGAPINTKDRDRILHALVKTGAEYDFSFEKLDLEVYNPARASGSFEGSFSPTVGEERAREFAKRIEELFPPLSSEIYVGLTTQARHKRILAESPAIRKLFIPRLASVPGRLEPIFHTLSVRYDTSIVEAHIQTRHRSGHAFQSGSLFFDVSRMGGRRRAAMYGEILSLPNLKSGVISKVMGPLLKPEGDFIPTR